MFLFLLLLRIFDDADQLFMLGVFERPFDRNEGPWGIYRGSGDKPDRESRARQPVSLPRSTALFERLPRMLDRQWAPWASPAVYRCRVRLLDTFCLCEIPTLTGSWNVWT